MKFNFAVLLLSSSADAFSTGRSASRFSSRLAGEYEDYLEARKKQGMSSMDSAVAPLFPPPDNRTPLDRSLMDQREPPPPEQWVPPQQKQTQPQPPPPIEFERQEVFQEARVEFQQQQQPPQQTSPTVVDASSYQQPPPIEDSAFFLDDSAASDDISVSYQEKERSPTIIDDAPSVTTTYDPPILNNDAQSQPQRPSPPDMTFDSITSRTERILRRADSRQQSQASGAGGSTSWEAFQRTEANWARLKQPQQQTPPTFVTTDAAVSANPECWNKLRRQGGTGSLDYDVAVCGGTLGIFFAVSLQLRGHRVCVVEGGKLQGRSQEWNISRNELMELVDLGILTLQDVEDSIQTEFPVCRSGFKNKEVTPLFGGYSFNEVGYECDTPDVLNLGVAPSLLIERATARFLELGGVIVEGTRLEGVALSESVGAALDLGTAAEPITTQLVLDCMGNASPISRQQRAGAKPDGVCAVVGCCANGYDPETNMKGDIIYTMTPIQDKGDNGKLQYFWESFPVGIGRNGFTKSAVKTTYMFTYMDANEMRPSLETIMEDYWKLLPVYQPSIKDPEKDLDIERVLFAYFPTYTDSPLQPGWSRILAVGDASGIQSPLSFGGFGALTRHLDRITVALDEALINDFLDKESLAMINPYTPNLSATWMFQKAMSVRVGQKVDERFVNRLLATNFEIMNTMGQRTIKPFLQDVVRFDGLIGSLARSFIADPLFTPQIVAHVGLPRLADWLKHLSMMAWYDVLHRAGTPLIRPVVNLMPDGKDKYVWRRRMDAWKYGSGNDYILPEEN